MGSYGSGGRGGKSTTNDMHVLDIRKIQRAGSLVLGRSFGWQWSRGGNRTASVSMRADFDSVNLSYRIRDFDGEWRDLEYQIRLAWTPCHYGGRRAWWLCPGAGCGRRVATLFGGTMYACRNCQHLAYRSQREKNHDRARKRANAIRKRLGWVPGIVNSNGDKPKGMHWATFLRLQAEHDLCVGKALSGMSATLDLVTGRLNAIGRALS